VSKDVAVVHHPDRRTDVAMPYAPAIVVRRGGLLFLSGITAAAVYHSHPHREEEFDLPRSMREQAVLAMENLKQTLAAAAARWPIWYRDALPHRCERAGRPQSRVGRLPRRAPADHDDRGGHALATHANCKVEITAIAVTDA